MTSDRVWVSSCKIITGTRRRRRAIGRHFSLESVSPVGQAERFSVVAGGLN
jgi:hypothetical protein